MIYLLRMVISIATIWVYQRVYAINDYSSPLITVIDQYEPLLTIDKLTIGLSIVNPIINYINHN
jgi:hypothetical protein